MKFIKKFYPPPPWRIYVIALLGIAVGFSFYLFYISKAWSYLSDNPATCVNCHIMAPQYATWFHSAHKKAVCNDCHVPHNNVFNKYYFKGKDGLRHATIFTLRMEPQVIFIKEAGKEVVQQNCIRCHERALSGIHDKNLNSSQAEETENRLCWNCHKETPHGRVNSLSAVQNARVPLPDSPVPSWLNSMLKK